MDLTSSVQKRYTLFGSAGMWEMIHLRVEINVQLFTCVANMCI